MNFTVHHEHGSHFEVSGDDGKPFKVAKQGLSPQLLTKIREHQVAQLFSGGKVRGYWDGGDVAPSKGAPSTMDTVPAPVPELASLGPTPSGATYGFESGSGPNPADELHDDGGTPPPAMQAALDAERPAFRDAPPGGQAKAMPEQRQGEASPPKPPDAPVPKEKPLTNPMGGLERDLVAAGRTKSEGEDEQAKVIGQRGAEFQQQAESHAQQLKTASEARQAQYAKIQQRANEVAEGIAHGGINPNQYWANQNTGQKIGSALAMILGGIGAGVSGQPNAALQIIDKAIDRDIEAQKANIENKKWLVGYYVQQGHSINEAAQLAKADLSDYAAAMHEAAASKFAGPEAQAISKQHLGDTQRQTASDRISVRNNGLDAIKKQYEIKSLQLQTQMMPAMRAANIAAEQGGVVPDENGIFLPADRRVRVPGGWALANSPDDRKEVADARTAHEDYTAALNELEDLKNKNALIPGGSLSREGKQALSHYAMASKALAGKSGVARSQEEEQLEAGMGNPTNIFRTAAGSQKLIDRAREMGVRHLAAVHNSRLVGGSKAATGLLGLARK